MSNDLWPHFRPLWQDISSLGQSKCLVAGGYGLYLKQQFLLSQQERIVIPFGQWLDATPRATRDLDLVLGLDLIADEAQNTAVLAALENQGFAVSEKPHDKRWKFLKSIDANQLIIAELHSPTPDDEVEHLASDRVRVKHKPSLGDDGVHGRHNHEAVGGDLRPFRFTIDEVNITVPNPVTWSVMKLVAAGDYRDRSAETTRPSENRQFARNQASKHANDVCRAIAMMTIDEGDSAGDIVPAIADSEPFKRAQAYFEAFFFAEDRWMEAVAGANWQADDFQLIQDVLSSWYTTA